MLHVVVCANYFDDRMLKSAITPNCNFLIKIASEKSVVTWIHCLFLSCYLDICIHQNIYHETWHELAQSLKHTKNTSYVMVIWLISDNHDPGSWSHRRLTHCGSVTPYGIRPWHDDVINWKHFPRNWPFVRGIHRSPVNSPHKGQWRGALMFSLICVWINDWVNNREAGDVRRYRAHYDVIVCIRSCRLFCSASMS